MKTGRPTRRACLVALAFGPALAHARVVARVPVMTRLVKLFLERESALFEAEAAGDRGTLERLLAPDFEQRDAAAPGRPLPRAEADVTLEQMAVHDLGEQALVSFLVRPSGSAARFVVDLWRRDGADWQLLVRYTASA